MSAKVSRRTVIAGGAASAVAPSAARARSFELDLHKKIASFRRDPLGFVLFAFPWGVEGSPLADEKGPLPWQRDILERLGHGLIDASAALRQAVASGHGIGKSALVAWIVLWGLSTLRDTRGVVTANTESQLRTKTWPELAKWHALALNRDWFVFTATALYSSKAGHEKTWRCDAITWSENNTEAIAGLHNKGRRAFALMDEASAIPDSIFETVEGALTDAGTELFWCVFGNPTRTDGRFRECFAGGRFASRWHPQQIDSRTVEISNKAQIAEWVNDYGEDSDFVRVRVKGMFPRAGEQQFIDSDRVEKAMARPLVRDATAPLVMGVDIGRTNDPSVIRFRQGLDARSIPPVRMTIPDLMQVASRVGEQIDLWKPAAVFVDMTGLGAGVVDRLHQLGYDKVVGVNFSDGVDQGVAGSQGILYANMRAKMYGGMKDWCKLGCLPEQDRDLQAQMTGVRYGYNAANAILLERKDDMRKRGLASPDDADALALTFAQPVAIKAVTEQEERRIEEKIASRRRGFV
jgi:hypothetical protein